MPPDTASTASSTPGAPADAPAAGVDDYGFPTEGDLSTEAMSDAELASYVDSQLGIKPGAVMPPTETPAASSTPAAPVAPVTTPAPAADPAEPAAPPATTEPEAPTETAPTLTTDDLWIEVVNPQGQTVKLTLDDGIPDDFMFQSDKQLFEVLESFNEMKDLRAQRQGEVDKYAETQQTQELETKAQQETMAGWAAEIQDLVDTGVIPVAKAQPANGTAYTQAEIDADPSLKLTSEVFDYMRTENDKRKTDGKQPITSFGTAFTMFSNDAKRVADAAATKQSAELAKRRGAMVGGGSGSAPNGGSGKGYVYKRGSARNIYQVDTSDI